MNWKGRDGPLDQVSKTSLGYLSDLKDSELGIAFGLF